MVVIARDNYGSTTFERRSLIICFPPGFSIFHPILCCVAAAISCVCTSATSSRSVILYYY
ncbi:hypothetical protein BDV11DRAFT_103948 [Aspergillus similis]